MYYKRAEPYYGDKYELYDKDGNRLEGKYKKIPDGIKFMIKMENH